MSASQEEKEERLALDLSRRKHFRLECALKAEFEADSIPALGDIIIRNIGLGGARLDSPIEWPMPCRFQLRLPAQLEAGESNALEISCTIAWTVADKAEGPFPTGVQFTNLDEGIKGQLFSYLARMMR